jgi:hypothetical protein
VGLGAVCEMGTAALRIVQHASVSHQKWAFMDERRRGLSNRSWLLTPGWYLPPMKHTVLAFLPAAVLTVQGAEIRHAT